jgi:hypothetical protein
MSNRCQAIPEGYGTNPEDCACGACEPDTFTGCLFCGCQGHDRPNCPTEHPVYEPYVIETISTLARDIRQSEDYDEQFECATAAKALRDALVQFVTLTN